MLALALAAAASAAGATTTSNSGTLSVEGASGVVTVIGRGALLGRLASGSVKIVDLSQADRWEPMINGIAGIEAVSAQGREPDLPHSRRRLSNRDPR